MDVLRHWENIYARKAAESAGTARISKPPLYSLDTRGSPPWQILLGILGSSYLRRPSILSMLFSALWEAVGPRRGRSPLTSSFDST
jgi:hypothetical protein